MNSHILFSSEVVLVLNFKLLGLFLYWGFVNYLLLSLKSEQVKM